MKLREMARVAAALGLGGVILCIGWQDPSRAQDPLDSLDLDPDAPSTGARITDKIDSTFTGSLMKEAERYASGRGVAYNPKRAYEIYRTVAETGKPLAIYHVARCLILGEGTRRDSAKGRAVLKELARTYILKEGFRLTPGMNPVTKSRFKMPSQLKATGVTLSTFKSRSGKVIADPKLLGISSSGIRVMHSTGVASLPWLEVPAHVQNAAGYDVVSVYFEQELVKAIENKSAKK